MRPRQLLLLLAAFLLGGLVLGPWWNLSPVSQAQPAPAGKVGKYQVSASMTQATTYAILCDTETGQLWELRGGVWTPLPSPDFKKK
jgi:hypothetical protein